MTRELDTRRIVARHACADDCRCEGCVLVHKGLAEPRWCTSCGSMGADCFSGCADAERDFRAQLADSMADDRADAAFALADYDTTGPRDPYEGALTLSPTETT